MNVQAELELSAAIPTLDDLNLLGAFLGSQHYAEVEVTVPESFTNYVPIFANSEEPEEAEAGALRYTPIEGL
jgi:hypothetical protein